ncbi:uncharacterized protein B0I36DRAFT_360683 [Microdochium trichocladiopsis]|uniref:Uncharacterized protein n=1 Tax=Microdochium trichocladiopsis TaxID=1682393 RepID=A0A9P8YC92_9PEZI|nr:uncharacterized protein B0I36DRAFT_360683 [Microdochium trichocladiopsis]KAH7035290.1 hypothetical protein B0I36DRAFT_360683 [Microdochium trichocladiopsis]
MPSLTLNTNITNANTVVAPSPPQGVAQISEQQTQSHPQAVPEATTSHDKVASVTPHKEETSTSQDARPGSPPSRRSESPQRPPYSPITPPLRASELPERPEYTHLNQLPQTAVEPPRPEPIDFASNPDVLALQSAIAILQMQKRKASADMVALSKAKEAALADPAAFLADLGSGKVAQEGDNLFIGEGGDSDSSSDGGSDTDDESGVPSSISEDPGTAAMAPRRQRKPKARASRAGKQPTAKQSSQPWHNLPKPQNVVRMPAINWAQYAIVGESLDKLHQEQVSAPTQGSPAVMQADGTYEFTFGSASGPAGIFNRQEKLLGVAAPYNPGKDKLASQRKGSSTTTQNGLHQQQQSQNSQQPVAPAGPAKTQPSGPTAAAAAPGTATQR